MIMFGEGSSKISANVTDLYYMRIGLYFPPCYVLFATIGVDNVGTPGNMPLVTYFSLVGRKTSGVFCCCCQSVLMLVAIGHSCFKYGIFSEYFCGSSN